MTITDDDTRGIELSATTLTLSEGGSETYTVVLTSEPTAAVTVTIAGAAGTDLSLGTTSLTLTSQDWDTPQSVTVSAAHDSDTLDDDATLTHAASGGDYASLSVALAVTVADDDVPVIVANGVAITSSPLLSGTTYGLGETIRIGVTFDQNVDVDTSGGIPAIRAHFAAASATP